MSAKRENSSDIVLDCSSDSSPGLIDKTKNPNNNNGILLLPTQLVNYRNKNYFASAAALVIGFGFSLYVGDKMPFLLFALFSSFFFCKGISIADRYRRGRIAELTATCTGIIPSFYRDRFTVTFAALSDGNEYVYYRFIVPNKRNQEEFVIGAMYVIYFDRDTVRNLLGYILLGSEIL